MILYKYLSFDVGKIVIQDNTISFTRAKDFNDPFELSAAFEALTDVREGESLFQKAKIFWDNAKQKYREVMSTNSYGILSLTRSPLNPLMWAHYADDHKGFVIGINVDVELFTSLEKNRIPVQFGSIIYTQSKPTPEILSEVAAPESETEEHAFDQNQLEYFQRLFLHKPRYWGYEEEVRIVKYIRRAGQDECRSGNFTIKELGENGQKLYLLSLPPNCIREVYLGLRNPLRRSSDERGALEAATKRFSSEGVQFFRCERSRDTWALEASAL